MRLNFVPDSYGTVLGPQWGPLISSRFSRLVPRRKHTRKKQQKPKRLFESFACQSIAYFLQFFAFNAQILHVYIFPAVNIPSCRLIWISPWFGSQIHGHWLTYAHACRKTLRHQQLAPHSDVFGFLSPAELYTIPPPEKLQLLGCVVC